MSVSLSSSVIVRSEMVLAACLSILGLEVEMWPLLIADATVYWQGLLVVGDEDLYHLSIISSIEPEEEARKFVECGYVKADNTYEELQQFTRSLIQRFFVLGTDRYGEIILEADMNGEFVGDFSDEDEYE